jgi:hypothetical protein
MGTGVCVSYGTQSVKVKIHLCKCLSSGLFPSDFMANIFMCICLLCILHVYPISSALIFALIQKGKLVIACTELKNMRLLIFLVSVVWLFYNAVSSAEMVDDCE